MAIINRSDLIKSYEKIIVLTEVEKFKSVSVITLKSESIDDIFNFANDSNTKCVYYCYSYYNIDDYLIPLDTYDEFSSNINLEIKKHNRYIKNIDFSKPYQLTLFTLKNGIIIEITLSDTWIDGMEIMDKDSKKSDIEDKFFEEFNIKKKEKRENAETDKEELKKIILNDPEFSYMKNQYLRNEYLNKLLLTNGMSKYKYLFDGGYDRGLSMPIKFYMDRIWEEYRESKRK